MRNESGARRRIFALTSLISIVAMVALLETAGGGTAADPPEIAATATATVKPPHVSVPDPAARMPAGNKPQFLSTIDPAGYRALKEAADKAKGLGRGDVSQPEPAAPPALQTDIAGFSASVPFPPDTDGAAGNTQYVQVVNSRVRVINKSNLALACADRNLNAFAGNTTEFVFDPDVIYDETWDRWALVFTRRSTSASDPIRRFYLAVSTSSNACGPFFQYTIPLAGGPFNAGDWWDYPHIGHDQDALLVTGNIFDTPAGGPKGAALLPIAKARVYNGLTFSSGIFTGLVGTLQPPIFIAHDQNRNAVLLAAPPNGTHLRMYRLREASRPNGQTLLGPTLIDVADYTVPPSAEQPGTTLTLDTLDNRFQNGHVQYTNPAGNAVVWQTHTVTIGGTATPRWYEIRVTPAGVPSVFQQGIFFRSGCSDDWMPSIAANTLGEAVVTWSSTQDPAGTPACSPAVNAEVRTAGRQSGDAAGAMLGNISVEGSATFYNDPDPVTIQRWGDYSAVSPDPLTGVVGCGDRRRFWLTNENIPTATTSVWGSRIFRAGFC